MAFYTFGHAAEVIRNSLIMNANKNISPISTGIGIMNHNNGGAFSADIIRLSLMGGDTDFLWGCHLWGTNQYKVSKG